MKFTKNVGKEILASWNHCGAGRYELPGGDMLILDASDGFEIIYDIYGTHSCGYNIIELANGLRFVLNDGTTRTYLYSSEEE